MIKAPIRLQDLRRSLYVKAKAEPAHRFWGLYVHICKAETLHEAYLLAKKNDGAPGVDGVTFKAIEEGGVESFLQQIRNELIDQHVSAHATRRKEIPKDGGIKFAFSRFLRFVTAWFKVRLSSSWSRSLKPIFNRDRMAIGQNGLPIRRYPGWPKRL